MTPTRRRRRAVLVSEVDEHLIAKGLPPSWKETASPTDRDADEDGEGEPLSNDSRLLDNVPPHAQPRI